MSNDKVLICPYCGETQPNATQCRVCRGLFEPLSRQATHNEMGPWFIRDPRRPFQPGCSYTTLIKLIDRGIVTKHTIVRGPTTRQFWTIAKRVPGLAHLFESCHQCGASVDPADHGCHVCGAPFGAYLDRNYMGLPEIRPMPWEPDAGEGERDYGGRYSSWAGAGDHDPIEEMTRGSASSQPTGLSSFATDAELFGNAPVESPGNDDEVSTPGDANRARGAAAVAERSRIVSPRSSVDDSNGESSETIARLQHKIELQERKTRLLAALAAAAVLVAVAVAAAAFFRVFPF